MTKTKLFTGIYDLQTSPFAFDFITFLAICDAHRLDQGCDGLNVLIIPGKGTGFEGADFKKYHEEQFPIEHAQWRFMNVFMPALGLVPGLHGITICTSRDHGREIMKNFDGPIFPEGYDIEDPPEVYWTDFEASMLANLGLEYPGFRAPPEALGFIDRWIEQNAGGKRVVSMTLREGLHGSVKNSDTEAWVKFAQSLDPNKFYPVFIPDMVRSFDGERDDLGGFPVFTDPTSNILIRMALYERSYISMFTSCGPISICFYNGAVRYLIFKTSPPYHKQPLPWAVIMGLDPKNNGNRVATPYQKRFAEGETFESLTEEFEKLSKRIEANPKDAFRRHKLQRDDMGPDYLTEVTDYLALDRSNFKAVEFCHRYMDRYPDQLSELMPVLAKTEMATSHYDEGTYRRSYQIYEDYLKDGTPDKVITWASVKVAAMLGDDEKMDNLMALAPEVDKELNENGILNSALLQAAVFHFKNDNIDEALRFARIADNSYRSASTINLIAMLLESSGQYEEARVLFQELINNGVETPLIHESMSRIYKALGDTDLSIDSMQKAVGIEQSAGAG